MTSHQNFSKAVLAAKSQHQHQQATRLLGTKEKKLKVQQQPATGAQDSSDERQHVAASWSQHTEEEDDESQQSSSSDDEAYRGLDEQQQEEKLPQTRRASSTATATTTTTVSLSTDDEESLSDRRFSSDGETASDDDDESMASATLDEEDAQDYKTGGYHPVRLGDVFDGRYAVVQKLGWGHFSTVWLAWDVAGRRWTALKIVKSAEVYTETACDEIALLTRVAECPTSSRGKPWIVRLYDHFMHEGPHGKHVCMVMELLGHHVLKMIRDYHYHGIPTPMVKHMSKRVLQALDCLHRECAMIHTDLKPENVLLCLTPAEWEAFYANHATVVAQLESEWGCGKRQIYGDEHASEQEPKNEEEERSQEQDQDHEKRQEQGVDEEFDWNCMYIRIGYPRDGDISSNNDNSANEYDRKQRRQERIWYERYILPLRQQQQSPETATMPASTARPAFDEMQTLSELTLSETTEEDDASPVAAAAPPSAPTHANVKLADLGNACWVDRHFTDDIQTRQYRSPEVILGADYDPSTDMWSMACMVFELLTGDFLFDPEDSDKYDKNEEHLALLIELLGPYPRHLKKGTYYYSYFNSRGHLKHIKKLKFWALSEVLQEKYRYSAHEAHEVASFLLPMLKFDPRQRSLAHQSVEHPWLKLD